MVDGPVGGPVFRASVETARVPTLKPGDIVVTNTLGGHKGVAVRLAIRKAGAPLLSLPRCSPDLAPGRRPLVAEHRPLGASPTAPHPIKQAFAKLKLRLRRTKARSRHALWRAVGAALERATPDECANNIRNAGDASVKTCPALGLRPIERISVLEEVCFVAGSLIQTP